MSIKSQLMTFLEARGAPGYEHDVAKLVAEGMKKYCDPVSIDDFNNVTGMMGEKGPLVYCCAHIDEIAMMVTTIEDDGFLGFTSVGGIDPRILMAKEVWVGSEPLYGIVGAKPPHVLSPEDVEKTIKMKDLYIDVGLSYEAVCEKVQVGDIITFHAPPVKLMGGHIASQCLDDRMGVAVMMEAMKRLTKKELGCRAAFAAVAQEEVGSAGANAGAQRLKPDMAIIVEVTFGKTPDSDPAKTHDLDKVSLMISPFLDRKLFEAIKKTAKRLDMELCIDVNGRSTGTDADSVQVAGEGVPCAVLQVPLRYMHTTVETLNYKTLKKAGRLLGEFLLSIDSKEG